MNAHEMFQTIMMSEDTMALATSVNNRPNVRVVNFGYDPEDKNKLFFTTFPGNHKIEEFEKNNEVACVILPHLLPPDGQVRVHGNVRLSERKLPDMIAILSRNSDDYAGLLHEAGNVLLLFEVDFSEVAVTVGMEDAERITL